MSNLAINPLPSFADLSGAPLQGGYLYLGVSNDNPQTNPIPVYQDAACTIPVQQPVRVQNGVPTLSGSPLVIYLQEAAYSILVNDSAGRAVYSLPSVSAALQNVSQANSRTDYPSAGQVQDGTFNVLTAVGGTGDIITAEVPLGLTALATDSEYTYTPLATNTTTTPTLSINGITAYTIVDSTGAALPPGALQVGVPYRLLFDGFKLRVISGALAYTNPAQQFSISYSGVGGVGTLTYMPVGPITFRSATAANGAPVTRPAPATPPSITLPSGATLGLAAGVNGNVVVALADNGGSPVLCVAGASPSLDISEAGLISPATISAGSTSAGVWYSSSAVAANSPYRVLGFETVNQASAGVWPNSAAELQGMGGLAFLALSRPYLRYHQIGEIFDFAGPTPPSGSIQVPTAPTNLSRTTYAALFNAITTQTTGTTTSGSNTITSVGSTAGMVVGYPISGPGIPSGATVASIGSGSITISANATASASGVALVVAQWGVGDGSTTFGCPYVGVDNATVHNPGSATPTTTGQVISHTHGVVTASTYAGGGSLPTAGAGAIGVSNPTGGASNLAAGSRVTKCLQVS